jgi:DNA-binding LacI/PurR family transcriptional regulator
VVFRGLDQACAESGFHYLTEYGEMTGNKPRMVTEQKIDGLLVKGASTPWLEQIASQFPVVGLNLNQPGLLYDQINCDDYHSGYSAAEYLWSRGHRRIAFVSNISHHPMLLMRYQGYERFLRLQRRFNPQRVYLRESQLIEPSAPEHSYPQFDEVLARWAALPVEQRPTAVLAANDWNAAGCYQTAKRLGLNIPGDLSVLGFDNTVELCTLLEPHLSSYKVAQEQCAYLAAKRLIQKIDDGPHDDLPLVQSVVGELVSRDSVRSVEVVD